MSLAKIKEEIRQMTQAERAEVVRLLLDLDANAESTPRVREVHPSDSEFQAASDHVFTNYGDLLRRLAQ